MTREENRRIIESFQTVLETLIQRCEEDNIKIHIFVNAKDNYADVRIEDYNLTRIGSEISLAYMPLEDSRKWKTEWRKEYKKSSAADQSNCQIG